MKNSIGTLLDSYVFDNKENIIQNGGNAAEHILSDAEAQDSGWLWFLTYEEIDEFEINSKRRKELIEEIRNFVNKNYNYIVEL